MSKRENDEAHALALADVSIAVPRQLGASEFAQVAGASVLHQFAGGNSYMRTIRDMGVSFDPAKLGATSSQRRATILNDPDALLAMVEQGYASSALAAALGFPNTWAYRTWLRANKLLDRVKEAEIDSAEFFVETAMTALDAPTKHIQRMETAVAMAEIAAQATTGSPDGVEAYREVFGIPEADANGEEVPIFPTATLGNMRSMVDIAARAAEVTGKAAERNYNACMRLAVARNPARYATTQAALAANGANAGGSQAVSITMNLGDNDPKTIKLVNKEPERSPLPDGLNFG